MKQTTINELDWLTDPNWIPVKVTYFTNHGERSPEQFDEDQAKSYGYDSVEDMNKHNYTKQKSLEITYGDKKKDLI